MVITRFIVSVSSALFVLTTLHQTAYVAALIQVMPDFRPEIDPGFAPSFVSYRDAMTDSQDTDSIGILHQSTSLLSGTNPRFICPKDYGKFPNLDDCSAYYYCFRGRSRNMKCPEKQLFDKDSSKCTSKSKAKCASKDDNDEYKDLFFECPYPYGTFAHPKDCSKFFLCLSSRPSLMSCKKHKLFHEKKRECVSLRDVDCGKRINPYGTTTVSTTTRTTTKKTKPPRKTTTPISTVTDVQTTTVSPTTTTTHTQNITETTSISTKENSTIDTTSTILDTTTDFTPCPDKSCTTSSVDNETSSTTSNTESTISGSFDDSTLDMSTNEDGITTSTEDQTSTNSSQETTASETVETPEVNTGSTEMETISTSDPILSFKCPKKTGMFPVQSDCSKYFSCRKFLPVLKECEEDTLFHEGYGFCYDAKDVDCGERMRPEKYSTPAINQTSSSDVIGQTSTVEDTTSSTSHSTSSTTGSSDLPTSEPSLQPITFSDATVSTSFITETDETTADESSRESVSTTESSETIIDDTSRSTEQASTVTVISTVPVTKSCEATDETCAVDENGLVLRCPETDGLFPHPTDRAKFIQCVHTKIYVHKCPGELVFDPKICVCVYSLLTNI